jgi:hypothetical protein
MSKKYDEEFLNKVFEDAQNDKSLLENIDINELIAMTENEKMDYLNDKTLDTIMDENQEALSNLVTTPEIIQMIYNKLAGYRHVENLYELHKGKHIRWIRHNNPSTITNGAIVSDIKFCDNGTHIQCITIQRKVFQIKYDDCMIFQKLTVGEQLVLMAYEYTKTI